MRAARGLAQGGSDDQRQRKAGKAEREEGAAPSQCLRDPSAGDRADEDADGYPQRKDRKCRRTALRWPQIGDQGLCGRHIACFANTDANPGEQQLRQRACQPAPSSRNRPEPQAEGDDADARPPIGQPRDWEAERTVEQREGKPVEQTELTVAEPQVGLDRLAEDADQLAIDEIDDIDRRQQKQGEGGAVSHSAPWLAQGRSASGLPCGAQRIMGPK